MPPCTPSTPPRLTNPPVLHRTTHSPRGRPAFGHAARNDVVHVQRAIQVDLHDLVPQRTVGIEEVDRRVPTRDICQSLHRAKGGLEQPDRRGDLARSVISTRYACASPHCAAVACAPASSRSKIPSTQPSCARRSAAARPMPLAPPVNHRLPFSPRMFRLNEMRSCAIRCSRAAAHRRAERSLCSAGPCLPVPCSAALDHLELDPAVQGIGQIIRPRADQIVLRPDPGGNDVPTQGRCAHLQPSLHLLRTQLRQLVIQRG